MSDRDVVVTESNYGKLFRQDVWRRLAHGAEDGWLGRGFCLMMPTFRCLVMSGG
jgi:hypothetical protein